jgi:hypothetical protein
MFQKEEKGDKRNERPTQAIIRIIKNTHKFRSQTNQTKIKPNKSIQKLKPYKSI